MWSRVSRRGSTSTLASMSGENVKCWWMISPSRRISSGRRNVGEPPPKWSWTALRCRIQLRRHLRHFAAQRLDIGHALVVVERDDGRAAAEPAERFAERDVKINREVARRAVVLLDLRGKVCSHEIASVNFVAGG